MSAMSDPATNTLIAKVRAVLLRRWTTGELFTASLAVIVLNLGIFLLCPTSNILEDEIAFYDTIWRTVQGQRLGIDYHNPLGFGAFQFAALLWKVTGPFAHVLKVTNALLSVPVALIACMTMRRYAALPAPMALLICLAVAFELSAPGSFGFGTDATALGTTGFYNRISIATLVVLFLHAFAPDGEAGPVGRRAVMLEAAIGAVLLWYLFLYKISALAIGLCILGASVLARRDRVRALAGAALAALLGGGAIWLTCAAFGIDTARLVHEYAMAGQAKGIPGAIGIANGLVRDPILSLALALLVFWLYLTRRPRLADWIAIGAIVAVFVCATFLLDAANEYPTVWMFAPALAIIAARVAPGMANGAMLVPATAFLAIIASQSLGTAIAGASDLAVAAGARHEFTVTAGKGIAFSTFCDGGGCDYARTINEGVSLIRANGLEHEKIATLTHSNPFPVLLLAPSHRGTQVWWNFGFNVPKDAKLGWRDVLGDASVVMVPLNGDYPFVREKLLATVRDRLAAEFDLVHAGKDWKVYRRKPGKR